MIKSFLFFLKLLFKKKQYDIVFSYTNHFNRGINGKNFFLQPFIKVCEENNIKYLLLEETDLKGAFKHYSRNKKAIYLDLITFLQILLRKLFSKKYQVYDITDYSYYQREQKVSKILKILFFRNLKSNLFITLAHNNVILWREINEKALICDYQHGIIWDGHKGTMVEGQACKIKSKPNVITLVYGKGFQKVLIEKDESGYFNFNTVKVIGSYKKIPQNIKREFNKVILWTLQNVDMKSNKEYYEIIQKIIYENQEFFKQHNYKIIFKNHPRYDRFDRLIFDKKIDFILFMNDSDDINSIINNITLHITSKSTTAFDMALESIPTIFIDMLEVRSPEAIFFEQYNYPLKNFRVTKPNQLQDLLLKLENKELYAVYSKQVYDWAREFYQDFNEETFLKLIKESKK